MDNQKPMSLRVEEFETALTELINNSALPVLIVEPIVAELHRQTLAIKQRELEADRKRWEEQMSVNTEKNGDDK